MALQKKVELYRAIGVPGAMATPDQSIYTVLNYTAETDISVGSFAFAGTEETEAKATGSATPLGLVVRNQVYPIYDVETSGTLVVPAGSTLTIAVRGDFYVKTTSAAQAGDKVWASTTDGTIKTSANASESGFVDTGWTVKLGGSANDTIIISAWNPVVAAAGGDQMAVVGSAKVGTAQI